MPSKPVVASGGGKGVTRVSRGARLSVALGCVGLVGLVLGAPATARVHDPLSPASSTSTWSSTRRARSRSPSRRSTGPQRASPSRSRGQSRPDRPGAPPGMGSDRFRWTDAICATRTRHPDLRPKPLEIYGDHYVRQADEGRLIGAASPRRRPATRGRIRFGGRLMTLWPSEPSNDRDPSRPCGSSSATSAVRPHGACDSSTRPRLGFPRWRADP
jgi:hypothetical protein